MVFWLVLSGWAGFGQLILAAWWLILADRDWRVKLTLASWIHNSLMSQKFNRLVHFLHFLFFPSLVWFDSAKRFDGERGSVERSLPSIGSTRFGSTWLAFKLLRYYAVVRSPECHLSPPAIPLLRHTRAIGTGCVVSIKNIRVSLVAWLANCVERMGRRLRVSVYNLP